MRPELFAAVLLLLGVSHARPSNGTLPGGEELGLRRRSMLPFDAAAKRDDCFGVYMRSLETPMGRLSGNRDTPGYRDQVGPAECYKYAASKAHTGLYYTARAPDVKATTKMPKDTSLEWKKETDVRSENAKLGGGYTCDHVVEISMVLQVLRAPGGVCETAQATYDAASDSARTNVGNDLRKKIMSIRDVVNNTPNLIFFQRRIEDIKTQNKINYNNGLEIRAGSSDMDYMAVADYLRRKTSGQSVADAIDRKIAATFGEDVAKAASMGEYWKEYIKFTEHVESKVEAEIEKQINKKKQEAEEARKAQAQCAPKPGPGGPWGQPRGPAGKPAPGQTGGSTSGLIDNSWTPIRRRVTRRQHLDRRAPAVRGASRAGPHAPPARACPLPGQPPKPVVPRSQMHINPAPAKSPRVPAQKPPVKPPVAKKVVARPVNRPRREVGKPAPPKKRVTPKKQPKRVPKPASKPKGKPRPRKRK